MVGLWPWPGPIPPVDGRLRDLEKDKGWCIEMLVAVSMGVNGCVSFENWRDR
jgi:hypothetical protein